MDIRKIIFVFVGEFIGTCIFMFVGCMAWVKFKSYELLIPLSSLVWGFAAIISIQIVGSMSGGHLLTSISIAYAILEVVEIICLPFYIGGQLFGSLAGYGILYLMLSNETRHIEILDLDFNETLRYDGVCATVPLDEIYAGQIFTIELLLTFCLIFCMCTFWDRDNISTLYLPPRIGLLFAGFYFISIPYTGGSFSSAKSFAPALISWTWKLHWIFWIASNFGAILSAILYRFVFRKISVQTSVPEKGLPSVPKEEKSSKPKGRLVVLINTETQTTFSTESMARQFSRPYNASRISRVSRNSRDSV